MSKSRIIQLVLILQSRLDIICASFSVVVMLASLVMLELKGFHPLYSITVIVGLVCVLGYLLFRNKVTDDLDMDNYKKYPHFQKTLILAVVLLITSILVFNLRSEQYVKPTSYYILMALSSGALFLAATQISSRTQFILVIICACAIGMTHIWTENALFPDSLLGIDPWGHRIVAERLASGDTGVFRSDEGDIIKVGLTTVGTFCSLMHLYLKTIISIFPLGYKTASLIFASSVMVIGNITLSGLIGKELFNRKVGAVAAIVVATANWAIFFEEWVIPNSIGATLSLSVAYLILMKKRPFWMKDWVVVSLIAAVLVVAYYTHIITALWAIATIVCLYSVKVVSAVYKIFKKGKAADKVKPAILAILIVLTILSFPMWLASTTAGISIKESTNGYNFNPSFGLTSAVGVTPYPDAIPSNNYPIGTPSVTPSTTPLATTDITPDTTLDPPPIDNSHDLLGHNTLIELTFDSAGMILYLAMAIVGVLIMIRNKKQINRWLWVILSIGILSLGFFPPLFGKSLIEHRWWYFAEVLLSVPLAVALLSIAKGKLKVVMITLLVAGIAFLSTIGLPSNNTNRDFSPNLIVRYAFTEKEMQVLDQVNMLDGSKVKYIGADPLYQFMMSNNTKYTGKIDILTDNLISGDFTTVRANIIILRDSIYKEPFGFGGGTIYRLNPWIIDRAKSQGYTEIWSNGEVHILERVSP